MMRYGFKLTLFVLLIIAAFNQPTQAANVRWQTLVSLTFDDGLTQSPAREILAKHGMHGTFYINSNKVDSGGGYLSKAEVDGLLADGNEIGGHTINHLDLATLSDSEQQAAICNDMHNLAEWYGLDQIHSFAYPFGSTGPSSQQVVAAGCDGLGAYESARAVGGLISGQYCQDCPWAESIPPGNRFFVASNASVATTTTLADMQSYVIQAEQHGGGWVPLVFHRVCDGCSSLAVSPSVLDELLTWLETRTSNDTYVRTVHQVMSGDYPAPPPLPQLGPNLIVNPSLEVDKNNQAECWYRSNYGSNVGNWNHHNDATKAHSGSYSESLVVSEFSSGDRKLLPMLDAGQMAGGCAPNVVAGEIYELSAWYKSTVPVTLVLFYMDANGNWQYWRDGPVYTASNNWAQFKYYARDLPVGAQALVFGLSLNTVGELNTDDYSMAAVLGNVVATDTIPPVIASFSPVEASTVTGPVLLTAAVSDNSVVQSVEFFINDVLVGKDQTNPYSASWKSSSVPNGTVSYRVRATDDSGNTTDSAVNNFSVQNDLSPPTVSFIQPPTPNEGDNVSKQVTLSAIAEDDVSIAKVVFLVNGAVLGVSNASPYTINWNTLQNADGVATLTAKAYDIAGNITTTPAVNVVINNYAGNPINNASLEIDANKDNIADCWQRGGQGNNSFIWSRLNNPELAHSGNTAESLQLTSRTSGDRKLVQKQDNGICAPKVTPGTRYTLNAWYKSTVPTGFVVYYRNSAGVWTYWLTSPNFVSVNNWTQASYTIPAVPAGATALSFGLYINQVGTLVTDDYGMVNLP
jgi:peptidoglycan/xylan/chitin deacetylase (PgdA/CDA1 family)